MVLMQLELQEIDWTIKAESSSGKDLKIWRQSNERVLKGFIVGKFHLQMSALEMAVEHLQMRFQEKILAMTLGSTSTEGSVEAQLQLENRPDEQLLSKHTRENWT